MLGDQPSADAPSVATSEPTAEGQPRRRSGLGVWVVLLLVFSLASLVVAFEAAMHFNGIAIDGPFQLFDALRRIQAGYRPGVDFQFFHGMGMPFVFYWLYRLLGGGLGGSELSRQLITTGVYPLVFLAFFRAFSKDWTRAVCLSVAAMAISWLLKFSVLMYAAVGMLGIRSAFATLLPVALYLAPTRRSRAIAGGLTLGAALFFSTEQGIAVTLAYVIVAGVAFVRTRNRRARAIESAATLVLAVLALVVLEMLVGGYAGMRGALRYNFSIVPKEQYWYFGVPPNSFIPSWSALLPGLVRIWPIGLALLLGLLASLWYLVRLWRTGESDESEGERRAFALASLPIYGVISCGSILGAVSLPYVQPLWRALLIIALVELNRAATAYSAARSNRGPSLGVPRPLALGTILLSGYTILTTPLIATTIYIAAVHIPRDHIFGHRGFIASGIWPNTVRDGQAIIDKHRGPHGEPPVLWSTYAGLIESMNGIFNPSFDYIIHALGDANRQAYVNKFRAIRPTLVQTMIPTYSSYEPWIEHMNWEFYDELLKSYSVAGTTPWSFYWERRAAPAPDPELVATLPVSPNDTSLALPPVPATAPSPMSALEVEIEYTVHNPLHALPLFGPMPRYIVGVNGTYNDTPVSLDPSAMRARFLVFVAPSQRPVLQFHTFSLVPKASYRPTLVRVYRRTTDAGNQLWMMSMYQRLTATAGR